MIIKYVLGFIKFVFEFIKLILVYVLWKIPIAFISLTYAIIVCCFFLVFGPVLILLEKINKEPDALYDVNDKIVNWFRGKIK